MVANCKQGTEVLTYSLFGGTKMYSYIVCTLRMIIPEHLMTNNCDCCLDNNGTIII